MAKHTVRGLMVCVILIMACTSYSTQASPWPDSLPARQAEPEAAGHLTADNPNPPSTPVKLIFVHHSTGGNWLASSDAQDPGGDLGQTLMNNNYFVSATNYGWGPDIIGGSTDIPNWPEWFTGPNHNTILAALYAESNQNICNPSSPSDDCFGEWPRLATDPGGENEIIMFKSCFPNSDLGGNPDDPPEPVPNYDYTVANAKAVYNDILTYFATRQDKLFVVITAPPLMQSDTAPERAANARAFNNWLVDKQNGWLKSYTHDNVAVFDYYNVLTSNGSLGRIDDTSVITESNDYDLRPDGNHHYWNGSAILHTQTIANNYSAYPSDDSHPTTAGHQKATAEFVQLLNVFYNRWKGGAPTQPSLSLTAPNGGENWLVNSPQQIRWSSTGSIANVSLAYSTDNFGTSHSIVPSIANTGSYTWTTPTTPTTSARVRVASVVSPTLYDDSDATFTLYQSGAMDNFVYLPVVLKNYGAGSGSSSSTLIQPTDLIYQGAFRLPDETSNGTWSYGGSGMSYYPNGDPGSTDGYPGSLFSTSYYPEQNYVSEFSIPPPALSPNKDVNDLPTATTLQPFADITEGRQIPGLQDSLNVSDIQYYPRQGSQTSDKLYWVMFEYYLPQDEIGHGWSELDLSNPHSQGTWRLGQFPTSATNKYLFEIPQNWADAHTPGKYLLAGRNRIPNGGSWGPAMYAFGPWNDGNPPANGSAVQATQLLFYPFDEELYFADHLVRDYSHADEWHDGAWLTSGDRSAVILAGVKALRREYELEYYGIANVDGCGDKGWHAEPYYAAILFYDPALLAAVVQGSLASYDVQPYAVLNVDDAMFQRGCRRQTLGGVGFDRQRGLVYILEKEIVAEEGRPIVHVFRLAQQSQAADLTPPTAPANLRLDSATATQVDLSWDAASDNAHLVGYIVYRYGEPIATTAETSYQDDKVNPNATYTYTVVAWDASNNLSAPGRLVATTPSSGTDTRVPIISAIDYTGLSDTGITINWRTDEPATTVFTYGVEYSGNDLVYRDESLTTAHQAVLSSLTPESTYYIQTFVSSDAAGNTNAFWVENWQFNTSPAGSSLNFRPILNGIGAKRISAGERLEFSLDGLDQDADDVLAYTATGLPTGATFDPTMRQFGWTPNTTGIYQVTFSVSDGDQTDSEQVTIFVTSGS